MSTESTASDESLAHPLVLGIALGVFASLLVRTAWMCDDAYISFRVADNLVHGYGLRWNVAERVQAFSNPLWTLTIATLYFFTRDVYYTGLVVSLALSLAAAWLLAFRVAATRHHALLALVLLSLSKAFVDYSTENVNTGAPLNPYGLIQPGILTLKADLENLASGLTMLLVCNVGALGAPGGGLTGKDEGWFLEDTPYGDFEPAGVGITHLSVEGISLMGG